MSEGEAKKESLLKNQPPTTSRRPLGMQIPPDHPDFLLGLDAKGYACELHDGTVVRYNSCKINNGNYSSL